MAYTWKVKPTLNIGRDGLIFGPAGSASGDALWLGTLAEMASGGREHKAWLSSQKEQVVAVVGKRGSGKSFTLGVIAEGLSVAGTSSSISRNLARRAVLLFDPLDTYWTTRFPVSASPNSEAQRHFEMAKRAGVSGLSFNVDAWVPGSGSARSSDPTWFQALVLPVPELGLDEWQLLLEVNVFSEPMGQALVETLEVVRRHGFTDAGGSFIGPTSTFDLQTLRAAIASTALNGYHDETRRALSQRLRAMDATGLFGATGTPIQNLVQRGRLSIILLERLNSSYRGAIVAVLTRMLIDDRARTAFAEKRLALDPTLTPQEESELQRIVASGTPRTVVALDEAQSFLAPGTDTPARPLFVRLVKEGRNIGLSAVLATQQPSAVDQKILSQVETFVVHQLVTEGDIRTVRDNLKSSLGEEYTLSGDRHEPSAVLRQLSAGQCLVSASDMTATPKRAAIVQVRPRATVHGGIEL